MDEQIAQLCTLQVADTRQHLRLRGAQECVATWLGNRLSVTHSDSSHITNFTVSTELLNGAYFWIRLLKSPTFRIRVLIDPKCPVFQIHCIRVQVQVNFVSQHFRSLNALLDEDLFESCLAKQPCFIENLDQHQDRTIRKYQRIASERLKESHQNYDLSDQTAELSSHLMRYRERLDDSEIWTPASMTQSSIGLGFFYNWNTKSFTKLPTSSVSKSLCQLKIQANSFSQTERSILCAWKAATKDIMITGPQTTTFQLPQIMYIYVDNDAFLEQWITECTFLGIGQTIMESGFLPSAFQTVDVVFLRPHVMSAIQGARAQVCNTLSFTLRMYHEGGFTHQILSTNDERCRKLYMSTVKNWTHNMDTIADLPIAWTTPGCQMVDDRSYEGSSTSVNDLFGSPQVVLRTSTQEIEPEDTFSLVRPRIANILSMSQPRKWLKNIRLKMCHVSPDICDVRLQQWTSLHHSPTDAEAVIQEMGLSRMMLRASLPHYLSLNQAKDIVNRHFEVVPGHTLADHSLCRPGSIQTRPIPEGPLTCQVCFDTIDADAGVWWTLCSHSFCADCGPMAFRAWTPNHNAGSIFTSCPSCRTNLSSFDVFRYKTNSPAFVPLDNVSQAIALETSSLGRRHDPPLRPLQVHIHCKHDFSESFFDTLPSTVHTLLFSHIEASMVPRWAPKILQWISSHKKNVRIVFVSPNHCHATSAFRKYFESP